jgi:cellulose synthase/poly-beta-1,6-N-acetylglucosamine synthase-like glycosyltransferase
MSLSPALSVAPSKSEVLDVSVVVPVHNEAGAVAVLVDEIAKALDGWAYEMIFVDDASKDDTKECLMALKGKYSARAVSPKECWAKPCHHERCSCRAGTHNRHAGR